MSNSCRDHFYQALLPPVNKAQFPLLMSFPLPAGTLISAEALLDRTIRD